MERSVTIGLVAGTSEPDAAKQLSKSVQTIMAGIAAHRSTGSTIWVPSYLSGLALAFAELGRIEEARSTINEAMKLMQITKETGCEAELHRTAGEIELLSRERR